MMDMPSDESEGETRSEPDLGNMPMEGFGGPQTVLASRLESDQGLDNSS